MPNPNHCEESIFVICNIKNNNKIGCVVRQPVLTYLNILPICHTPFTAEKEVFFPRKMC